jgi:heme-degrading monooxygenase HmoA
MAHLLVRHAVQDYAKFKTVFDGDAESRRAGGSRGGHLFRSADNPNELVVLLEWSSLEKARQFAQSEGLQAAMQRAGVVGRPDVLFVEKLEDLSV